jgi:hypothetical protein
MAEKAPDVVDHLTRRLKTLLMLRRVDKKRGA